MHKLTTTGLKDFQGLDGMPIATLEELKAWHIFQTQCLLALIAEHGEACSILVDVSKIPPGNFKMYAQPLDDQMAVLTMKEI